MCVPSLATLQLWDEQGAFHEWIELVDQFVWCSNLAQGDGLEAALCQSPEAFFTRNFSLGIEYKHIELDDELHVSSTIPGSPGGDRSVDASIDVVQARLTLRMGRDEPLPERVPLK